MPDENMPDFMAAVPEKEIRRTIPFTMCRGKQVDVVTGKLKDFGDLIFKEVTSIEQANRILRRRHEDSTITICDLQFASNTYRMPMKEFLEHATVIPEEDTNE